MLTLCWFPLNSAWCFVFHAGNPALGSPINLCDEPYFYAEKADATAAAKAVGLTRVKNTMNFTAAKQDSAS